jgi:hypothetical protein
VPPVSDRECSVELTLTPALRVLGRLSALSAAIRAHTLEETRGFAEDIVRKLGASHLNT